MRVGLKSCAFDAMARTTSPARSAVVNWLADPAARRVSAAASRLRSSPTDASSVRRT